MTLSCLFPGAGTMHGLEKTATQSAPACSEVPAQALAMPSTSLTQDSPQGRPGCFPSPPHCCSHPHGQRGTCGARMLVQVLVAIKVDTKACV